jgi:hypothetical protein
MDSAYYTAAVIAAIRRNGARFSVTAPVTAAIRTAIAAVPEDARTAIAYPQAVWDDQLNCRVSDAEVAAFTSKKKELHVAARLIVRRVRDKDKDAAPGQGELFPAWRHHAVFTDYPYELVQAEEQHRGHAIIEQLLADLNDGPLAHLPSGKFNANAAWLAIAAIAHNLLRPAGTLVGRRHARARPSPSAATWPPSPPARRNGLTSPDPVRTPDAARQPAPSPPTKAPDKPQNRQRQAKHAVKALTDENGKH